MIKTSAPFPIFSPEWRAVCPSHSQPEAMDMTRRDQDVCFSQEHTGTGQIRVRHVCGFVLQEGSKCPSNRLTGTQYYSEHFLFLHLKYVIVHDQVVVMSQ